MIHLRHPIHGEKLCDCEREAVADEKNGWVRVQSELRKADEYLSLIASPITHTLTLPRKNKAMR